MASSTFAAALGRFRARVLLCCVLGGVLALGGAAACGDNRGALAPQGLVLAPERLELRVGDTGRAAARYQASDGDAAADDVAWSSSDPARAAVTGAGAEATIRALAPGEVTITATGRSLTATLAVSIAPASLLRIAITPARSTVPAGTTVQLAATAAYSDGTTADVTAAALWTSDREGVATVFQGLVRGRAPGEAAITARLGGVVAASAQVTVEAVLQSIAITPPLSDVPLGADHPLRATGTFSDASTADITEQVAWSSSDAAIATISNAAGTRGLADAVGTGTATITAQLGAVSSTAQLDVFLAPVGPWAPEPGVPAVVACSDGVKFSMASDLVYVCTTTAGVLKGTITGTAIAWASANTGITNLEGQALVAHTGAVSTLMYMGAPRPGVASWFRSQDGAATFAAFTLLDSAGSPRAIYSGRFQSGIGNLLGSWDPGGGTPQAVILTGSNPPANVRVLGTASGTVRAITGSAATNTYAAVYGETPAGAPATGGIFRSTNNALTWAAQDSGIPAADKDRVYALVLDPLTPAILYAGLQGGGRVYKTSDAGAMWAPSAAGLPAKARVSQLLISPQSSAILFAATQIGLYRSDDAGASWTLAGFQGRRIRAVAQSGAAAALILVAVDDAVGLYRAL